MGGIPRTIELEESKLIEMAEQGMSINQCARAYKCKTDNYIRNFLVNFPELYQKFTENGRRRQTKKTPHLLTPDKK